MSDEPNINPENIIKLKNQFGILMKMLPGQNSIQIKITKLNKNKLLQVVMKALKILSGVPENAGKKTNERKVAE